MMMNVQIVLFSCLWFTVINADHYNYDKSKGSQYDEGYPVNMQEIREIIERDFQKSLDYIKHMGQNTNDDMRKNSPFGELGDEIDRNLKDSLYSLNNLGDRITKTVNEELTPLNNLGHQINHHDSSRGSQYDGGNPLSQQNMRETIERELQKSLDSNKHMRENTNDNDVIRKNSPFATLGDEINRRVKDSLYPLNNLGDYISERVNEGVAPLSKLGDQIRKTVKDALKNVHWATSNWVGYNYNFRIPSVPKQDELKYDRYPGMYINDGSPPFTYKNSESRQKLLAGVGGNTVLNISSSGKVLVARYGVLYKCDREFNQTGDCVDGALSYFQPRNGDDFCFVTPNSQINNRICLGATDGVTFSLYNGYFSCKSSDGSPTLLITTQEYEKMCKKLVAGITYTYTPDLKDPFHVSLPLTDPTVKCKNTGSDSCVFTY